MLGGVAIGAGEGGGGEGWGFYGLIYCVTASLHGKQTGNGKVGIKAQEYIKDEGGGKKTSAETL